MMQECKNCGSRMTDAELRDAQRTRGILKCCPERDMRWRFEPDEWVRLPSKLKLEWWRATEYGKKTAPADLVMRVKRALIKS
jgi:hypothetical protein